LIIITLMLFSISTPSFAGSSAPSVSPDVWIVRALGNHRIVIQRQCNPEHCTSRAFLERLSDGTPTVVTGSVGIAELNDNVRWAFVENVTTHVGDSDESYYFEIHGVDTHGTEAMLRLRITPGNGLTYTAKTVASKGPG
jgi:hypothetical protein